MTRMPDGLELEPGVQVCVFGTISKLCDGPTEVWGCLWQVVEHCSVP